VEDDRLALDSFFFMIERNTFVPVRLELLNLAVGNIFELPFGFKPTTLA
jgi:hypothetical protein